MSYYAKFVGMITGGVLAAGCAQQPVNNLPPTGRVVEYGLWQTIGAVRIERNPATLTGMQYVFSNERLIERTDRIPARKGTNFGFSYKLTGISERGLVTLKEVITHPPILNTKGVLARNYAITETVPTSNGTVEWSSGYYFNRPQELVPGKWTFEVWYRDQKLVSQSFDVYSVNR